MLDLLEPSLLPSLVAGLTYFACKLWETEDPSSATNTLIPTLETLLRSPSSPDSAAIHSAVLAVVAKPLDDALTYAQRTQSLRTDIQPLLDILKPYLRRSKSSPYSELETWTATPGGGLLAALNQNIQSLLLWTSVTSNSSSTSTSTNNADISMSPPHYTHNILSCSIQILGAKAVLKVLIDELTSQSQSADPSHPHELDMLFDIITTMIVAPLHRHQTPTSTSAPVHHYSRHHRPLLTLRDVLHAENANAYEISRTQPARAATIVRLSRRVEAFFPHAQHVADQQDMAVDVGLGDVNVSVNVGTDDNDASLLARAMGDAGAGGRVATGGNGEAIKVEMDIDDVLKDAAAGGVGAGGLMEEDFKNIGMG